MNGKVRRMRTLKYYTVFMLLMMTSAMTHAKPMSLKSFLWQHRILLIDVSNIDRDASIFTSLKMHSSGIEDRKLKIILYTPNAAMDAISETPLKLDLAELKDRLANKQSILIGLDGGTKSFYDIDADGIDIKQVFADIDGMPMRKSELRM